MRARLAHARCPARPTPPPPALRPARRRNSTKTYAPDEFEEEHSQQLAARYAEVAEGGREIHKLLLASNRVLKVSKGAPIWRFYVEFINDLVVDGLARTVANSLKELHDQIDPASLDNAEGVPLLEIQLELVAPDLVYQPQLCDAEATSMTKSVRSRVEEWCKGFFHVCKLVKRLDRGDGDFVKEVAESEQVRFFLHGIGAHLRANEEECAAFKQPYLEHATLWTRDIGGAMAEFLAQNKNSDAGAPAPPADADADEEDAMAAAPAGPAEPALALFDKEILHFKELSLTISQLPTSAARGWLRIDAKPVRQALSTWVTKWSFAFTQYLLESVENALLELDSFMSTINAGLEAEVDADDEAGLVQAMTHIRDVRLRSDAIDAMFEPLRGKEALLKKYGIAVADNTKALLENAPFLWEDTRKATDNAKERLGPLQAMQADRIKMEAEDFGAKAADFRHAFVAEAPFKYEVGVEECYEQLDTWQEKIAAIEAEAAALKEREGLFDVTVHQFRDIGACRQELRCLKLVWDHVDLVESTFGAWRATLWPAVDVDEMQIRATKLQKEVKVLVKQARAAEMRARFSFAAARLPRPSRQVRTWDVYTGMARALGHMLVALPLVQDLRDEAMRERHWKKLMRVCGKSFVMDDKFALHHLLALQLQDHVDAVGETVEQVRVGTDLTALLMMNRMVRPRSAYLSHACHVAGAHGAQDRPAAREDRCHVDGAPPRV